MKRNQRIALASGGAIVLGFALSSAFGGSPSAAPKYTASIQSVAVQDPGTVSVTVRVKNIGNAAGSPDCTVYAFSPNASYNGFNEGTLSSIAAGSSSVAVMPVTISGNHAQYIDAKDSKVTCK